LTRDKNKILNDIRKPFLKTLLNSPLHSLASKKTLVVRCIGKKTGKRFSVTPPYFEKANKIYILSNKSNDCWTNMRNGANVVVVLKGKQYEGWAESLHDEKLEANILKELLQDNPLAYDMVGMKDVEENNLDDSTIKPLQNEFGLIKIKI
jgi:hypothetical protein